MTEHLFLYVFTAVIGAMNTWLLLVFHEFDFDSWSYNIASRILNSITLLGVLFYFSATKLNFNYDIYMICIYIINIVVLFIFSYYKRNMKIGMIIIIIIPVMIILRMYGILPLRYILWSVIDGLGGNMSLH